jgi:hypothetical protein
MEKYFIVDFWEFFKNRNTEISHLYLQRHFEFFQKLSSMIC